MPSESESRWDGALGTSIVDESPEASADGLRSRPGRPPGRPVATAVTKTVEQSIIISRPVADVFAYRSALENGAAWQSGVLACELAVPGSAGLGTRCTEIRRGPGGAIEAWELEITEYEPDSVVGVIACCGLQRMTERHMFTSEGDNTRYTLSVEISGSPALTASVQRKIVENLVRFRERVEDRR